ncbi:hypothetical protein L1887_10368 [Cichorium endivia]|nr:hypothetical protein L1887_10368 [Cichorium endivia]
MVQPTGAQIGTWMQTTLSTHEEEKIKRHSAQLKEIMICASTGLVQQFVDGILISSVSEFVILETQPFPRSALLLTTNIPTAIPSSLINLASSTFNHSHHQLSYITIFQPANNRSASTITSFALTTNNDNHRNTFWTDKHQCEDT